VFGWGQAKRRHRARIASLLHPVVARGVNKDGDRPSRGTPTKPIRMSALGREQPFHPSRANDRFAPKADIEKWSQLHISAARESGEAVVPSPGMLTTNSEPPLPQQSFGKFAGPVTDPQGRCSRLNSLHRQGASADLRCRELCRSLRVEKRVQLCPEDPSRQAN
jgi:hypothetical protein